MLFCREQRLDKRALFLLFFGSKQRFFARSVVRDITTPRVIARKRVMARPEGGPTWSSKCLAARTTQQAGFKRTEPNKTLAVHVPGVVAREQLTQKHATVPPFSQSLA